MTADPLLTVVLGLVVKATLLLAVAALAAAVLRGRTAADRHMVWFAALAALAVLPIAGWVTPGWELPGGPWLSVGQMAEPVASPLDPGAAGADARVLALNAAQAASGSTANEGVAGGREPAISWLVLIWLSGVALVLIFLGLSLVRARWMLRRSRRCRDPRVLTRAKQLSEDLGIRREPDLLTSADLTVPAATGLFRPSILLPARASDWSDETLRSVLIHELAHVRRHDLMAHVLGRLSCALYWPHPGVWLAARRLRSERERACDDLVLAAGVEPTLYAACLLDLARAARAGRGLPAAAVSMAKPRELEGRLLAVLDGRTRRPTPSKAAPAVIGFLALLFTLPLAGAHLPVGSGAPNPGRAGTDAEAPLHGAAEMAASIEITAGPDRPVEWPVDSAEGRPGPPPAEGGTNGPAATVTVYPRLASGLEQRARFLAETRAVTVPVLRVALNEDPDVTDAVLDGIATAAAYDLWRMLVVRITLPTDASGEGVTAWAEGNARLSMVRGPVEHATAVVSTLMGPLPGALPERVLGNLMARGLRAPDRERAALEAGLRSAGAELERRWVEVLTGRRPE